jgi:alkanesulfonate monooxygenase SsuD/methylene tetrahydromethanopterin reductase-like flavin-dependent oxidoreductase (luciferase family)
MNLKVKKKNNQNNIKFGCYIYQDGLRYKDVLRITLECERLGYDSIWLKDNFIPWIQDYLISRLNNNNNNVKGRSLSKHQYPQHQLNQLQQYQEPHERRVMLECWTVLSSLVALTRKIKLGAILVNPYRNPAIVAKMATTLDNISNGRLELGLSAGWYQKEAKAYGVAFPSGSTRVEMLKESIIIIRKMLHSSNNNKNNNNAKLSFKGKYYNISNAECNPKPIQKPYLPIWIGGGGKKTLDIVAKYADGWNYGLCSFEEYLQKTSFLKHYYNIDNNNKVTVRNYKDIIRGWHGILLLGKDEEELKKRKNKLLDKKGKWKGSNLIISGTPNTILNEITRYLNIGVTYFTIYFPDLPDTRSLQLFAEHIIPNVRSLDSAVLL